MADANNGVANNKRKATPRPRKSRASTGGGTAAAAAKRSKPGEDKSSAPDTAGNSLKGVFAKELGDIMFAYGDTSRNPIPETVDVLEALTVLFVRKTVTRALDHASVRAKIDEHDIQFVLRKDARKAHRAAELLVAQRKCKEYKAGLKSDNLTGEDIRDQLMLTADQEGGGDEAAK